MLYLIDTDPTNKLPEGSFSMLLYAHDNRENVGIVTRYNDKVLYGLVNGITSTTGFSETEDIKEAIAYVAVALIYAYDTKEIDTDSLSKEERSAIMDKCIEKWNANYSLNVMNSLQEKMDGYVEFQESLYNQRTTTENNS